MYIACVLLRSFHSRQSMRRRFESAYLKYALLKMVEAYPSAFSLDTLGTQSDIADTLADNTPKLFQAFQQKYAGKIRR